MVSFEEIIKKLEREALRKVPPVKDSREIVDYFEIAKGYLQSAGACHRSGDYEGEYCNLVKYITLIENRLHAHRDAYNSMYSKEYQFNVDKCKTLKINRLKIRNKLAEKYNGPKVPIPGASRPPPSSQNVNSRRRGGGGGRGRGRGSSGSGLPPPPKNKKNESSGGGFWGSFFGGSGEKQPLNQKGRTNLPPPPPKTKRGSGGGGRGRRALWGDHEDFDEFGNRMVYRTTEKLANNENVQDFVGKGVSKLAENEYIQQKTSGVVRKFAENEEYQEYFGSMIASSTENEMIRKMAQNKDVQKAVGKTLSKTVGNTEFQKKTGKAIAKAATNKKVQKAAAKGIVSSAKGGWVLGKIGAKLGYKAAKAAYEEYDENNVKVYED